MRLLMLLPLAIMLCAGCSIQRLEALVQAANDRQWKTCFKDRGRVWIVREWQCGDCGRWGDD